MLSPEVKANFGLVVFQHSIALLAFRSSKRMEKKVKVSKQNMTGRDNL